MRKADPGRRTGAFRRAWRPRHQEPTRRRPRGAACKTEKARHGHEAVQEDSYAAKSAAKAMAACVAKAEPAAEEGGEERRPGLRAERDADRDAFAEK